VDNSAGVQPGAQRRTICPVAHLRPVSRARLAVAGVTLGAALAGAAILHGHRALHTYSCSSSARSCLYLVRLEKPGWVDPLALGIVVLGVAGAAGFLLTRRALVRLGGAALVFGAALAGAVIVYGHHVVGAQHSCPSGGASAYNCVYHPRPGWVGPTALGIALLGLAGAGGVLAGSRGGREAPRDRSPAT